MEKTTTTSAKGGLQTFIRDHRKLLIIGGSALLVLTAGGLTLYLIRRQKKKKDDYQGTTGGTASGTSGFRCSGSSYPLTFGTCHPDVAFLQQYLRQRHQADLGTYGKNRDGVDGKFGATTRQAALKYLGKESFSKQDIETLKNKR